MAAQNESPLDPKWAALVEKYNVDSDRALFEALGGLEGGENAFPEDLYQRGRQIFQTAATAIGDRLCNNPEIALLINSSGPRISETLTIVPLIFNLLPDNAMKDASVVLIALLIVRMGLGTFCRRYGSKPRPTA